MSIVDFDPLDAYTRGLEGARKDPRADEVFADHILRYGGDPNGSNVCYDWGLENVGAGRLTLLFPILEQVFPGCLPGAAQLVGDCVAAACSRALATTIACEVVDGKPDEVTGHIEGAPELPKAGIEEFPIAQESLYWHRGFASDGWVCSEAAQVACEKGFLIRKPYPSLKLDLTTYTKANIRRYGVEPPEANILAETKKHIARTATFLKTREQVRDMLAAGFGCFNCSSMGFERVRGEWGVSRQVGRWAHAQALISFDDRPETHKKFGQALVLWCNSWSAWNSGDDRIYNDPLGRRIPPGCFWALADTIDRCGSIIALSSVAGWPKRRISTWGAEGRV
jgi:hypothetical protein